MIKFVEYTPILSNFDAAKELFEDEQYSYADEQLAIDDVKAALAEWEVA